MGIKWRSNGTTDRWMTNRLRVLKIETRVRICTTGARARNKQDRSNDTHTHKKLHELLQGFFLFLLRRLESSTAGGGNHHHHHHRPTALLLCSLESHTRGWIEWILFHCGERKQTNKRNIQSPAWIAPGLSSRRATKKISRFWYFLGFDLSSIGLKYDV